MTKQIVPIDPDIMALNLDELRLLYMQSRLNARQGMKSYQALDNESCWDGLVVTAQNLLPKKERTLYNRGKFLITRREFIFNCEKHATCLAAKNVFPPDEPYRLE